MPRIALCLILVLTACARPPALDGTATDADRRAPYPRLLPLSEVLAGVPETEAAAAAPDLGARIAALNARADALRGPVVPNGTRTRMGRGIDTGALR